MVTFSMAPVFGPHPPVDASTLESRTCATGSGHQSFAVTQENLTVGADIDQQCNRMGVTAAACLYS